jgi:hypothetical protein
LAHNLLREPGRGSDFFIFFTRNPLKRLDSEKKMKGNERKFTSVQAHELRFACAYLERNSRFGCINRLELGNEPLTAL